MDTATWQDNARVIGYFPDGRPIFSVSGGDGTGDGGDGDGGNGDGGNGDGGGDGGDGGDGDKGFQPVTTQEQFDRMVSARLARERSKFADYDQLKDKAGKYDKLEDSQKTELQKANDRASTAEQESQQAKAALQDERTENAVYKVGAKLKIQDLEAAHRLLDLKSLEYDDDGRPKEDSVKAALEQLVKDRPYLASGGRPRGSADGGPKGGSSDRKGMDDLIRSKAGR